VATSRRSAPSSVRSRSDPLHGLWNKPRRNGATTRTPMASPVHQTAHPAANLLAGMAPETTNVPAPIEALISMLRSAARKTMAKASCSRSISLRKPTLTRRVAATIGASVLPVAVAAAASPFVLMGRLTARAASATPGHTRHPKMRNATTAMPVGGHSGVTFLSINASRNPRVAAT
jgi:hypothetical protein